MFRGRETTHPERGERLLMKLAEDVAELGAIEQRPTQDGRNMTMMLGPVKRQVEAEQPSASPQPPVEQPAVVEAAPAAVEAAPPASA